MPSVADICTMALSHLGHNGINSLDERSAPAQACRTFYEPTRDEVLRAFDWPFATAFATLALVEEAPTAEWAYSYRYLTDCLALRRLLSVSRVDTRDTRVKYRIGRDATGKLIYTDLASAEAEYTVTITNPEEFAPDFALALSYLLAVRIAPRVTGGEKPTLVRDAFLGYQQTLRQARNAARAEEAPDVEPDADLILAREG